MSLWMSAQWIVDQCGIMLYHTSALLPTLHPFQPPIDTSFVSLSQQGINPMAPEFHPQFQRPPQSTKPSAVNNQETKHPRKAKKQFQPKNTTSENTQQKGQLCINKSEEDWRLRLRKRRSIIAFIKEFPEYQAAWAPRGGSHQAALRTPSPDDRSVSKRQWEEKVMKWRNALKHKQLNGLATKTNASA